MPAVRGGLTLLAALSFIAAWAAGAAGRRAVEGEADRRAALLLAGYLATVAPLTGGAGDARLLSAAGALVDAEFWSGSAQVWLDHTPLLPVDTTGTHAAVVPLLAGDGTPRGSVAVWGSVPEASEMAMVTVSVTLALVAIVTAALVGALSRRRRFHVILAGVAVTVVAGGVLGVAGALGRTANAASDAGLLRTRRVIEVVAVRGRLSDEAIVRLTPGVVAVPLEHDPAFRDPAVAHDAQGRWVIAMAARGQTWRLIDPTWQEIGPGALALLLGFGILALLATLAAAALPPSGGYLTDSRSDP